MAVVLSAPLGPDELEQLPLGDGERQAVEGDQVAVAAGQPLQFQHVVLLTLVLTRMSGLDWHLSSGPGRRRPAGKEAGILLRSYMSGGSGRAPRGSVVRRRLVHAHRASTPSRRLPLADEAQWDSMPRTCQRSSASSRTQPSVLGGWHAHDAAKPQVGGGGVDGLRHARRGPVPSAVVLRAQV